MIRRMLTAILIAATITGTAVPAAYAGDGHRGWHSSRHEYRGHRDNYDRYRREYRRHDYRDGRHGYRHHHHRRSDRKKSKDYSDEILIGAGIVGLAIIAGSMMMSDSREPDITWSDPPRRDPVCDTDVVSRTLPDGRIQYGDRTRCY